MRHIAWSYYTFLPSSLKIFQMVFDLQSGHEINGLSLSKITKGDNTKSKKGRVVILVYDTSSGPVLHFCQVPSKYSKGYWSYRVDTKSFFKQEFRGRRRRTCWGKSHRSHNQNVVLNKFISFLAVLSWKTRLKN